MVYLSHHGQLYWEHVENTSGNTMKTSHNRKCRTLRHMWRISFGTTHRQLQNKHQHQQKEKHVWETLARLAQRTTHAQTKVATGNLKIEMACFRIFFSNAIRSHTGSASESCWSEYSPLSVSGMATPSKAFVVRCVWRTFWSEPSQWQGNDPWEKHCERRKATHGKHGPAIAKTSKRRPSWCASKARLKGSAFFTFRAPMDAYRQHNSIKKHVNQHMFTTSQSL